MTQQNVTFEVAGNSNGLAMTAANSGFTSLSGASGVNAATIDSSAAAHGSFGGTFSTGTGAANGVWGNLTPLSTTDLTFTTSFVVTIPAALPSAGVALFRIRNSAGTILDITYTSTGTLATIDAGALQTNILTAAQATAGLKVRVQVYGTVGGSTTTGAFTAKAYTQSTGIQLGSTVTSSTANLGTTAVFLFRAGVGTTVSNVTVKVDDIQVNTGTTTPIGDLAVNSTPPTIVAGANQSISSGGSPVTLTATGTAASGSAGIASYAWTCLDYPSGASAPTISGGTGPGTTSTATFTPTVSAPGRYRFSVTCTDLEGNTSTAAITKVFYPGTAISPLEVTANTGFTLAAIGSLSDSNDSTYADSGAAGSNNQLVIRLNPLVWPVTGFSLDIRSLVTATGGTQSVQLLEGASVRKDWGAISPGTSAADTILTLTSGEIATITSGNELDLRFTQV